MGLPELLLLIFVIWFFDYDMHKFLCWYSKKKKAKYCKCWDCKKPCEQFEKREVPEK